jgi:hypothetical protein
MVCIVNCKLVETLGGGGVLLEGIAGWHGKMRILYDKETK